MPCLSLATLGSRFLAGFLVFSLALLTIRFIPDDASARGVSANFVLSVTQFTFDPRHHSMTEFADVDLE